MDVNEQPPVAPAEGDAPNLAVLQATIDRITRERAEEAAIAAAKIERLERINETNASTIAAITTINAANAVTIATVTADGSRHNARHDRLVFLLRLFKKAHARELHMRHKSDGRHGAACGRKVKQLEATLIEYKYHVDAQKGDLDFVNGFCANIGQRLKHYKARVAIITQKKDVYKQKYKASRDENLRIKAAHRGDPVRAAAIKMTVLEYLRAVVDGTEPYDEFFTLATLIKKIAIFAKDGVKPENSTQLGNALIALKFTGDDTGVLRLAKKRVNGRAFDVPKLRIHLQQFAAL
jgi:hypothetical protein